MPPYFLEKLSSEIARSKFLCDWQIEMSSFFKFLNISWLYLGTEKALRI